MIQSSCFTKAQLLNNPIQIYTPKLCILQCVSIDGIMSVHFILIFIVLRPYFLHKIFGVPKNSTIKTIHLCIWINSSPYLDVLANVSLKWLSKSSRLCGEEGKQKGSCELWGLEPSGPGGGSEVVRTKWFLCNGDGREDRVRNVRENVQEGKAQVHMQCGSQW